MNLSEINQHIMEIKKKNRHAYSNVMYGKLDDSLEYDTICLDGAIAILTQEERRNTAYYAAESMEALDKLLKQLPNGYFLEYFHSDVKEVDGLFDENYLQMYAKYARITTTYSDNPYQVPEKGRRALLSEAYDAMFGEYANLDDVKQIMELCDRFFDPKVDDFFSEEEWRSFIKNKECLVHRENGKVTTVYLWRLEGKKMYSNMSINVGPANYMYNLERRVFEKMWEKGIRTYYFWVNMNNTKQLKRANKEATKTVLRETILYDTIYIKNDKEM